MNRALFAILLAAFFLAGCATYGQDRFLETPERATALTNAKPVLSSDRAQVYLLRRHTWLTRAMVMPVPPLYCGLDGAMSTILPVDSYLPMSLEPGRHVFTAMRVIEANILDPVYFDRKDIAVDMEAGKTYYVSVMLDATGPHFENIGNVEGQKVADSAKLAKFIYSPVSVDTFIARVSPKDANKPVPTQTATMPTPTSTAAGPSTTTARAIQSALPSQAQVTSFLEVLATVALVGVLILGAALGGTGDPGSIPTRPVVRPSVAEIAPAPPSNRTWNTGSGARLIETSSGTERRVVNISTGVQYRIEGDRISGTDGTRYRISGTQVFSDSGQSMTLIGNNLFTNDGRSCVRTGVIISCK